MKNQYRKKPIVIEAFQMTRERRSDNSEWTDSLGYSSSIRAKEDALARGWDCYKEETP